MNLRSILLSQLSKVEDDKVAILLSGGVDSCSLLFGLLELNKKVVAYTFMLEGIESEDFLCAKNVARTFNIEFIPVILPNDINILKNDLLYIINTFKLKNKAEIECAWTMYRAIKEIRERSIITGLGADGYFCLSKKGMMHYKHSIDLMNEFRQKYFSKPNHAQNITINQMCQKENKIVYNTFLCKEMYDKFIDTSWDQINKPKQKQPILNSFPEYFKKIKIRPHTNLQLGDSGIEKHFEQLLSSDWNLHNYKSVVGIYNSITRGEIK